MSGSRSISVGRDMARPYPARRWPGLRARGGSALAALLCNALILAALWHDFDWMEQPGPDGSREEMKTFALSAPMTQRTPDPPSHKRRAPSPAHPPAARTTPPPTASTPVAIPVPQAAGGRADAPDPSPAPSASSPDTEDRQTDAAWDAYQATIWGRIAARKPQGIHLPGEVTVAFTLDTDGRLVSAGILRSGGTALLDRLALRTLHDSSPFPPPPPAVRDRPLRFVIRFGFH